MRPRKVIWVLGLVLLIGGGTYFFGLSRMLRLSPRDLPADFQRVLVPQTEQLVREGQQGLRAKQYAPVIETLKRMLARYPDNRELKKKLGLAYFAAGRYPEAEPLLKEVQATDPDPEVAAKLSIIAGERER